MPEDTTAPRSSFNPLMEITTKIFSRARQYDPHVLATIHDELYPVVYRYVRYRLDDDQVCEDIASEVFLRLLTALRKRSGPKKDLRGWLLGTASNLVNDHLRAKYRRPETDLDDHIDIVSSHDPEEDVASAWQKREVGTAFMNLTLEQQHVLALRFSEERSIEETAQIMGKSVGAVKTLQFRALAALRRLLEVRAKR